MKHFLSVFTLILSFTSMGQWFDVPVYTVTSVQPSQPGSDVSRCIDNDNATIYHSKWGQSGIPDELDFYFTSNVASLKKMVYTPRQAQTNGIWTDVTVSYSTQADPATFVVLSSNLIWALDNQDKTIDLATAIANPYIIRFTVNAAGGNFSSCAEMRFYSETEVIQNNGIDCAINTANLALNGANDVLAVIQGSGSTASSFQGGENIDKSFDGNTATLYHSSWSNTIFPVVLNYALDGTTPIDFLKYTPRSDGGSNGNFGNVIIEYNTLGNATFQPLTTFDFAQSGTPTNVQFPTQITPLNIRITVQDGYGGFASCAEMQFYTAGNAVGSAPYTNVFADNLYSTLLPTITQLHIDTISVAFYKELAQCLFDGTYNEQYRVQAYEVYPTVASVSSELKIGTYDNFENPTGIVIVDNEKIALFVDNLPSTATVNLAVKDFQTGFGGAVAYYPLVNGLNVFQLTNGGMGYISYYNGDDQLNDVDINIVSGKVNGYFDRASSSNSEWPDLLMNTSYPYIDIVGEFAHLVYDKSALSSGSTFDAIALIGKYDTIVQHERMVMGLFKYDRSPKNHMLTYCEHGGGYYAGGLGVHLDLDWGVPDLTDPDQISIWGIAHEYGHINQIRPDLKWIGTTEVTTNIYSAWVDYHLDNGNNEYTRLEDESVTPAAGIPSITGGRINGALYNTLISGLALQDITNYDVFKVLVPFWQLEIYYSLAGASRNAPILSFDYPTNYQGKDYAHWFGDVAEIARTSNTNGLTNGEHLINFVKNTCDAVEENLIPFFQSTGFLKPIDVPIDDYGVEQLTVTQTMIVDVIAYVEGKNYDNPVSPVIHYASAHSVEMYNSQLPLSGITGTGFTMNGNYLTIDHAEWHNAVAYETYDSSNVLIYVSMTGSGDPTNQLTQVYYPNNALAVYAVGFDGQRILVFPATLDVDVNDPFSSFMLYPNPVGKGSELQLNLTNTSGEFNATVVSIEGREILTATGTIDVIESAINQQLGKMRAGTYLLSLENAKGQEHKVKFVKE